MKGLRALDKGPHHMVSLMDILGEAEKFAHKGNGPEVFLEGLIVGWV